MTTLTASPAFSSPTSATIDDAVLVSRFNSGDESAFAEIVSLHRQRIFGYVRKMLRDETDAEEVTQDTFVRAYRHLDRFRGDSSLLTWLHRIAGNLARNRYWYFFRRRRQDTISLDYTPSDPALTSPVSQLACEQPDPYESSTREEFTQSVRSCLDDLDPLYREPLEMRAAQGMRYAEISRLLGVPVGTVKSRICRARRDLRARLSEELPELRHATGLGDYFHATRS